MSKWNHLIGKVFKRGGGKYEGYWIVIGLSPGDNCLLLGFDKFGRIVGASSYQPYYVDSKKELARIDVSEIRFENDHGQKKAPDLSTVLPIESIHDG